MDMMTMMTGSMPQAPVMGALTAKIPAGPVSTGQSGEESGNGLLFAQLLGTTLQAKFPGILPTSGSMSPELAVLSASGDAGSSTVPADADQLLSAGKEEKEGIPQSAMQLINGLRMLLAGVGNGAAPGQAKGKAGEEAGQLLAELQKLVDRNGSLTPSLQEQLRGVLNPAVIKKEGQIEVSVTDDPDTASGEQKASEMLAALIAALNSGLKQNPQQVVEKGVVDKPVDETHVSSGASLAIPVVKPEQQTIQEARPVQPDGKVETSDEELFKAVLAELKPNQVEKPERSASQQAPAESKAGASGLERVQPKVEMFHSAAVTATVPGKPIMTQEKVEKPENDTKPVKPEMPEIEAVEIVFKEEAPILELSQGISQKQEPTVGVRQEIFRSESIQALSREPQMQQVTAERPVVEMVSREQIVSQVREKLENHRITADNGQVTIRLHPLELGELKINIRMDEQRLRVEIVAENRAVKDALMENVGSLKEALARQNMDMKQFDVSTGSRQFFNQGFREGRQQEQQFVTPRQSAWLMGHVGDAQTTGPVSWQPKKNALLDMMM